MSSHDMFFEGIVVAYKFHSIDAYGDDTYFFKLENKNSLDEFNNFFKNNLNFEMKFVYRKNSDVYIKVKHEYVTNLFEIPFEKGKAFKANLQLIFYENKESIGYFPKITLFEDGLTFPFELRP